MSKTPSETSSTPEDLGYEFLIYGHEQILRGSDTAVLAAFAALAYQGLSGSNLPHQIVGFGLLMVSVMMCAVVHFAVGNLYTSRARRLIRGLGEGSTRPPLAPFSTLVAWIAGVIQVISVLAGATLILIPEFPGG